MPSSFSIIPKATSEEKGVIRSCNRDSSSKYDGGIKSGRDEIACAILTYAGPSCNSIFLNSAALILNISSARSLTVSRYLTANHFPQSRTRFGQAYEVQSTVSSDKTHQFSRYYTP
uniref:Putative ovule protein n=1 Tax=Solanum chacoense TaxID=4108 RepID=A0A0V0GQU7_SOLCH